MPAEINETGTLANRGSASDKGAGYTYKSTDAGKETYVSNGTAWVSRAVSTQDHKHQASDVIGLEDQAATNADFEARIAALESV